LESDRKNAKRLKIVVQGANIGGVLDTGESITGRCHACRIVSGSDAVEGENQILRLSPPGREIKFAPGAGTLVLDLELQKAPGRGEVLALESRIPVEGLAFERPVGQEVESSVVAKGRLRLKEIAGRDIPIEPGQVVHLGRLRNFEVQRVALADHMVLRASGLAGEIKTGYSNNVQDQRPSYLDWLRANQSVNLYLGVLGSILSVVLAALYRLKILEEK
jgi:hypothetical protein